MPHPTDDHDFPLGKFNELPSNHPPGMSPRLVLLFASACGLTAANIYYGQPLIALIAPPLRLPPSLAGLIVALTQLGYGAGLLLLVPLADMVENRRLVILSLGGVLLGLAGSAAAPSASLFLLACFVVGGGAAAAQILVPFASQLVPEASRGRVVGNVMAGLLAGIMLARPFSSLVAAIAGWRAVFASSAMLMALLVMTLRRALPTRRPHASMSYARTLGSLPGLFMATALLRRRAFYQGMLFAAFNVFWTGSPLLLTEYFGLHQEGIALFALAGAGGALVAPLAGRLADRGLTRSATGVALGCSVIAFALGATAVHLHSLSLLIAAALLLDAAVQLCQVLGLRSIYMLAAESRGRLNGLYMSSVFLCGAGGSAASAAVYRDTGWSGLCWLGAIFGLLALGCYATEFRRQRAAPG